LTQSRFQASFAKFDELLNDEKTRTFIVAELGAGYEHVMPLSPSESCVDIDGHYLQLKTLTLELASTIRALRQETFYEQPRYHVSIAWALLDAAKTNVEEANGAHENPLAEIPDTCWTLDSSQIHPAEPTDKDDAERRDRRLRPAESFGSCGDNARLGEPRNETAFATIPSLPSTVIAALNETYAAKLTHCPRLEVERICIRIGKHVSGWDLRD
jgi:U6 snRNA phosphodiesterase